MNADVNTHKSQLAVEVLDEQGEPIPGFTRRECLAMKNADNTKYMIVWKKNRDLSSLAGKVVRFKFYLTNGDLYAFWVSPWETGESRGYLSGGGPGLHFSGIDTK